MNSKWLRSSPMFIIVTLMACIAVISTFERSSSEKKAPGKSTPEAILQAERDRKIERRAAGYAKPDQPDKYMEMQLQIRTREGDNGPRYKANYKIEEMKKAGIMDLNGRASSKTRLSKSSAVVTWTERGPANFSGRARGLIVDPTDASGNTWFVGSVGGGVWKTTDAGLHYTDKTPNLPNLATTVLAIAESNHDVIYAGTGEGFGNADAIQGDGIFKSTDHGESWTQLSSTAGNEDFFYVNRLVIDPDDEDIVVAATNKGILKSSNGGSSWTKVYTTNSRVQHIIADFTDFNIQYATVNGFGVIKSTDAGDTWSNSRTGITGGARFEIAMAPSNHNRLYLAAQVGTSASNLYMSTNAGSTWMLMNDVSGTNPNWLGAQGWYDNTIAVDPYNDTTLFVGGINIWKIVLAPGLSTTIVRSADTIGTSSFLGFTNFGLGYLGGGLGTGFGGFGSTNPTNLTASDSTISIEIRFGSGTQKAHRFKTEAKGAGQTTDKYHYQNYVTIPFQAWDVTNNRQLMVSFRDEKDDGAWDLSPTSIDSTSSTFRDYVFIHAVTYDANNPNANIAVTGGIKYKEVCEFGPKPPTNTTPWDPNNLPTSKITFNFQSVSTGFKNTTQVTNWYPGLARPSGGFYPWTHADNHNIIMIPKGGGNFHILIANDAGVAHSTDGGVTWIYDEETPDGMNSTQFYGIDKKPGELAFIGGTQDNGTWRSPVNASDTSRWIEQLGGDGFDAVWKANDGNTLIGSLYDNRMYKSTDGGLNWFFCVKGMESDVNSANSYFITQIARSKQDPDLLFAIGASGVWRSDNFAESWTLAPLTPANFGFSTLLNHVAISEANPQIVWAGTRMSSTGKMHVSTDGGLTFNPTINYTSATLGALSGLATHPTNANTAYALFSIAGAPKILRTINLGQTWTDISGFVTNNSTSSNGFPDVATYCLMVNPNNTNELWAGTEIGLFISTDNGGSWSYANNGLPAVAIWELKVVDDQIVAATHGRGIWTMQITTPTPPAVTLAPRLNSAAQSPATGHVLLNVSLRSAYDSTLVKSGNTVIARLGATPAKDSVIDFSAAAATYTFQVTSYKNGTTYKSGSSTVNVIQVAAPVTKYTNNFNAATTDFSGSLFTISTPAGFSNGAMHSAHPYVINTNLATQLNVPITVTPDSCILLFDEIVLVEEGDPGTVFGDAAFWDYCIVEGSSDGINWIPLENGYDSRLQSAWHTAYTGGASGSPGLYRKHAMNILSKFNAGTTIFIRFRLYSDEAAVAWGWAVDNVAVNPDRVPPTLTLGALASPVVNVVRFAVGANENLSTASVLVNSNALTMTKQGSLFFGNYTITSAGNLTVVANGADSSSNFGTTINRNYTVSQLSKSASFENFTLTGNGDGYWVLGKSVTGDVPSNWYALGAPIDVAATGSASGFKAEFNYGDIEALRARYAEFEESKIGIYERIDSEWKYAGGEGKDGKVAAAFKGSQLAVFYNPDHKFIPTEFALAQNYPNPFNPSTTIRYDVAVGSKVVLKVYNMLGQEVATLVNAAKEPGRYEVQWNGKNQFGHQVASGMYLYRLEAGKAVKSKKMLFIK